MESEDGDDQGRINYTSQKTRALVQADTRRAVAALEKAAVEAACALCRPACPNGACCLQTVQCAHLAPMALATRRGSDASEDEPGHGWVEELKISQIEQSKLEEELRQIKESTTIRESCKR